MSHTEDEMLQLSGLQHFAFCRRQWALIHIEDTWIDNFYTTDGSVFHNRAHDETFREKRGDTLILRGLSVSSYTLGLTGKCDIVEFHRTQDGITLHGESGLWFPVPVEYKRGKPKSHRADELQLCAQAMCLEEMLCCSIPQGALFYGETHRRVSVVFDSALRESVTNMSREMHNYFKRGYTPRTKQSKKCAACSLQHACLPDHIHSPDPSAYLKSRLKEEDAL